MGIKGVEEVLKLDRWKRQSLNYFFIGLHHLLPSNK